MLINVCLDEKERRRLTKPKFFGFPSTFIIMLKVKIEQHTTQFDEKNESGRKVLYMQINLLLSYVTVER